MSDFTLKNLKMFNRVILSCQPFLRDSWSVELTGGLQICLKMDTEELRFPTLPVSFF